MASTAKPPDPMPYSLAAFLLPASRRPCVHARACILGPYLYTGCARVACVGGGSRGNSMGAGGRCLVPRVVGVRWSGPGTVLLAARRPCRAVCGWACGGLVGDVSSRCAGLGACGRLGWFGVLWLFLGCCSGGSLGHSAAPAWGEGGLRKRS